MVIEELGAPIITFVKYRFLLSKFDERRLKAILNKIIKNHSLRRRLRLLTLRLNLAVSAELRGNFTHATGKGFQELSDLLRRDYLPNWYEGTDMNEFLESEEGRNALENHLIYRLEIHRYNFVPWINSVVNLSNKNILLIGCGTGSSTLSMAEQGAKVTALDIDSEALKVAKTRCLIHGISAVRLIQCNATEIDSIFGKGEFDLIVFFAVLEHMTIEERKSALRAAWNISATGKHLCIADTPNRLWFYDGHTSNMPFFHWLPDELAFEYSAHSPRAPFNKIFRKLNTESLLRFIRHGRGMSFHELDLSLGNDSEYEIVSDMCSYLCRHNPAYLIKHFLSGDFRREKLLNYYAPVRQRVFFR